MGDGTAGRVPNEIFWDRDIRGITRMQVPGDFEVTESGRIRGDDFFRRAAPPTRDPLRHFGGSPMKMAAIMAGAGFLAVFVNQAPFLFQLVLGAPIFEELLKFGIALLIAYPLRFRLLRIPIALAAGLGFGWLEHVVTYSGEPRASFYWRLAFHALSPGLAMAVYQGLERLPDVRLRWGAPLLPIFIHYVNNALAIPVAILGMATTEVLPLAFSAALVCVLGVYFVWALVYPPVLARFTATQLYRFTDLQPPRATVPVR